MLLPNDISLEEGSRALPGKVVQVSAELFISIWLGPLTTAVLNALSVAVVQVKTVVGVANALFGVSKEIIGNITATNKAGTIKYFFEKESYANKFLDENR